jgi:threonine synthase
VKAVASCSTCASNWPRASWTIRRASAREILEAEGTYVAATSEEREGALAKLAAEDAAIAERAAARAAEAQAAHDLEHVALDDDELDDDELVEEEA